MLTILLSLILGGFIVYVFWVAFPPSYSHVVPLEAPATPPECKQQTAVSVDRLQPVNQLPPYEGFGMGNELTEQSTGLGLLTAAVIDENRLREPLEDTCQPEIPCAVSQDWNFTFPGCATFHIPLQGNMAPKDNRLWQADLNPLIAERQRQMNKEPNMYEHMQGRQKFMQFLASNLNSRSDPHMKPIASLDEVDTRCRNQIEPFAQTDQFWGP